MYGWAIYKLCTEIRIIGLPGKYSLYFMNIYNYQTSTRTSYIYIKPLYLSLYIV